MENKITTTNLEAVESTVRGKVLRELPKQERMKATNNLVECAMRMGLMDAYEIRLWIGMKQMSVRAIAGARDRIKKRWLEEVGDVSEAAATTRAVLIKKVWEEIRKCESLYDDAKSVGDKVKVKQHQLQLMQYVAKLNFVDAAMEDPGSNTQVNVIQWSKKDD
jgi:hypothetical protein